MEEFTRGISTNTTPFITSILAPQLKLRKMPLYFVDTLNDVPTITASYSLLDGEAVLKQPIQVKQKLSSYLKEQETNIALVLDKNYRQKLDLLELGFHYCLEIPTATEVIIKTIENNLKPRSETTTKQFLRDAELGYQASTNLSYIHDKAGRNFLVHRTKSIYLSVNEQRILEYFFNRKGFVSKNELSYAGWKHFEVRPNTVTVTVKKLRSKITKVGLPYSIRCLYGYGYILEKRG